MFTIPSFNSVLYTVVGVTLLSSVLYIKHLQYTISSLEQTISSQSITIASLNQSMEKYKTVVEESNKLEEEKNRIQSSFSSVQSQLAKIKTKANECKPLNKDEIDSSRVITDDIARVLSLSDCKVRGEPDCDSKYAEGRVFHIYTP